MIYNTKDQYSTHCQHKSKIQRINYLKQRIQSNKNYQFKFTKPQGNKIFTSCEQTLQQLFINILTLDQKLSSLINVFPKQLAQLQKAMDNKKLRKLASCLNFMISLSKKQIKDIDSDWITPSIYLLQKTNQQWQKRQNFTLYKQWRINKNYSQFEKFLTNSLQNRGINQFSILTRALNMRVMIDFDKN